MEKRAILAVALMAAVLILYQTILCRHRPRSADGASQKTARPRQRRQRPRRRQSPSAGAAAAPGSAEGAAVPPQRLARVETPLYRRGVSSEGGQLQELDAPVSRREADGHRRRPRPRRAGDRCGRASRRGRSRFRLSPTRSSSRPTSRAARLVLTGEDGLGLRVPEMMRVPADSLCDRARRPRSRIRTSVATAR